jgi:spore coat protein U-like protein
MNKLIKTAVLSSWLFFPISSVLAATDGTEGATSEGTSEFSANITASIIIKHLENLDFGSFTPGNAPSGSKNFSFCVGTNMSGNKGYSLEPSGNFHNNGKFTLTLNGNDPGNDTNKIINYEMDLTHDSGTIDLQPNVEEKNLNTDSGLGCNNPDQKLTVEITSDTTNNVRGSYTDTVTFLVSPR